MTKGPGEYRRTLIVVRKGTDARKVAARVSSLSDLGVGDVMLAVTAG